MKIAIFGDGHITKNMKQVQSIWDISATESFYHMYTVFDDMDVEMAVCLGDLFDAPRIEAKSMNLILPILDNINNKSYPTYILLGNHEADSTESNILEFLSSYENIIPITNTTEIESMLFIPYYDNPQDYDMKGKIVFTHHDIYGSDLASGKTKSFFGLDPSIFKEAKLVMNGHVHLKSRVSNNIINAGSLLVSQQGELRVGEYPSYYILDTVSGHMDIIDNIYSMIYLSIDEKDIDKVTSYDNAKLVLRIDYSENIPQTVLNTLHTSWRKKISNIGDTSKESIVNTSNFDMKNYLIDYLKKDGEIPEEQISDYISTGLELLS